MYISTRIVWGVVLSLLMALGLSGCKMAKIVKYEHEQSAEFYNSFDFESDVLNDFKVDDVLLVIDINKITHTSYAVWLGLYSNKVGESINIERAVIVGNGWKRSRDLNFELIVETGVSEGQLFQFENGLKIFEVEENFLMLTNAAEELSLTIFYNVGRGTESITFLLKRIVEKQAVFAT